MREYISVLLWGGAFFAAVIILLTAEPKISKRLTAIAGGLALIGGLLVYGYGYFAVSKSFMESILRTVFAICRMFIGEADFGDISEVELFSKSWATALCWTFHVLALYATSSAALSLIGANVLKMIRLRFSARRDLNIIYGDNEEAVNFSQTLVDDSDHLVVYVTEEAEAALTDAIRDSACVLRTDANARSGNESFLKSMGVRKGTRSITLYAISQDYLKNLEYARSVLTALERRATKPQQIRLVIHAREDETVKQLQVSQNRFGYGFVTVFQEAGLTARLLIQKYPPCHSMTFDSEGLATSDFEAIVIGFDKIGQTVLRNILMNAQFEGSTFRADVFSPAVEEKNGFFTNNYQGVMDNYQVVFHSHDGRSKELYAHLSKRLDKLKYLAVCTGSDNLNEEITDELREFFRSRGKKILIHQCSYKGIRTTDTATDEIIVHDIYQPDILSTGKLDAMAMIINHYYMGQYGKGVIEDWMECDYFSRMSSRAFADYIEAVLCAAGRTAQQASANEWEFTPNHLLNLGKMEHSRWNAFHFCMGFLPMSPEEYDERTQIYREQLARGEKQKIRIGKNLEGKTHACLISWDDLNHLSDKENSITGGTVDYQQMDLNNVLLVPTLLQINNKEKMLKTYKSVPSKKNA